MLTPEASPSPAPATPSPYQVPVAASEGAGHLPGAGSPGWGCQALPGCKVGRYGRQVWGVCEKDTAEMLPWTSRLTPGEELSQKLGVGLIVGRAPNDLKS